MNKFYLERKIKGLPNKPGVYYFKDRCDRIIYIGKAKSLKNRVRSYFQNSSIDKKTAVMVSKIKDFEIIITNSEIEALILEANLVREHKPRYNVNLKDDKSYPYIRITKELFPRVFPTRRIIHDGSRYFGPYTDVKSMKHTLKFIRKIFPIRSCSYSITEESIKKKKVKVCLDYYIKKCLGACEGFISSEKYQEIIKHMIYFINGKNSILLEEMRKNMEGAAEEMKFEEAARLRDNIGAIENFSAGQKLVLNNMTDMDIFSVAVDENFACGVIFKVRDGKVIGRQHFYLSNVEDKGKDEILKSLIQQYYIKSKDYPDEIYVPVIPKDADSIVDWLKRERCKNINLAVPKIGKKSKLIEMGEKNARLLMEELKIQKMKSIDFVPNLIVSLQKDLHLKIPPKRIAAFDISNISGTDAVASMVFFENGLPKKSEYRRFKIKTVEGANDFAMIGEVIRRRYRRLLREKGKFPDLILIDGGKGQVSSAVNALKEIGITSQALAGIAKKYEEIYLPGIKEPQSISKSSQGLKLLQRIRDESHRFALQYHKKLRKKRTIFSKLDNISGIGKVRKERLLRHFGSLEKIKKATPEEVLRLPGFNKKVADKLLKELNQN
ncbi:excinuclease ABC subunit UvrC [candidate division KSB1 bacterium]